MRCNGTVQPIVTGVKRDAEGSEINMSFHVCGFQFHVM